LSTRHREIAFDPARMKIDEFHGFTRPIREGTRAVPDSRVPAVSTASAAGRPGHGSLGYNDWNIRQGEALPFSFDNDSDEVRGDYGGFRLREL
jgi:hypothetical protein